ncbi:MAG: hypothetical protein K1X71_02295 [Pirellulales bacterium]|nr:hypothetical protein [Pirellulales bacterium]
MRALAFADRLRCQRLRYSLKRGENGNTVDKLLLAERDENTIRKDFLPSEAVAIGGALEVYERKKAKERQREGGKKGGESKGKALENFATPSRATDKVAQAVGMSRPTYEKAKAVVEAAKADPKAFGDLPKLMAYSIINPMARASSVVSSRPGDVLAMSGMPFSASSSRSA